MPAINLKQKFELTMIQAHDLVMDDQAKTRWQRAKPPGVVVGLPGYLVGGEWVGVSLCATLHISDKLTTDYGRFRIRR
jgi:hypothetical protein